MNTMVIENAIEKALIYERCGVSKIFIDLELIGKQKRQGHLNTHITNHKMKDVSVLSNNLSRSKLLVRINPIHKNSKEEIEEVISRGANIIMLPMFKEKKEVEALLEREKKESEERMAWKERIMQREQKKLQKNIAKQAAKAERARLKLEKEMKELADKEEMAKIKAFDKLK